MKTHRFEIAAYLPSESDGTGNVYIDWPEIHRQAGLEHVKWIKSQDPDKCQMILERKPDDTKVRLVAEIYSDRLATEYALMWAK